MPWGVIWYQEKRDNSKVAFSGPKICPATLYPSMLPAITDITPPIFCASANLTAPRSILQHQCFVFLAYHNLTPIGWSLFNLGHGRSSLYISAPIINWGRWSAMGALRQARPQEKEWSTWPKSRIYNISHPERCGGKLWLSFKLRNGIATLLDE